MSYHLIPELPAHSNSNHILVQVFQRRSSNIPRPINPKVGQTMSISNQKPMRLVLKLQKGNMVREYAIIAFAFKNVAVWRGRLVQF